MAATPTELLAVDAQRLEESNQRIVTRLDALEREFIGFRSRINVILAIVTAQGVVVLGSAGMIWTGVSSFPAQTRAHRGHHRQPGQAVRRTEGHRREARPGLRRPRPAQGRLDREVPAPAPRRPRGTGSD